MRSFYLFLFSIVVLACQPQNPNEDQSGQDELISLEISRKINLKELSYKDIFYIPIYSDIYVNKQNQNSLLAATLSIRNTSFVDSLIITQIDYYNTDGALVRSYLEGPISLSPMATVNYVIEKEDTSGGAGANFIVALGAKNKDIKPVIQAIMIGENGSNQGFAFTTLGYSIADSTYISIK